MKKILMAIGQLVLTILYFVYVALIKIPLNAVKRTNIRNQKTYLEGPVPDDYRAAITGLADNMVNRRFLNSSKEQTKLIARLMVNRVVENGDVLIYSDSLEQEFYTEILCHSRCHFRILVGNTGALKVIKSLPQHAQNRIDCRAHNGFKKEHFLVIKHSFRYELPEYQNELLVICNFYEPETAQKLRDRFEAMWGNSTQLLID